MPNRKKIPAGVQKEILLKSRRRCCLCFWLDGLDEVVKGQIAHLDQDASNNDFENLAFLCFEHHDEYDSRPNVSKGLQQMEVLQWRDELYKEMEYRFRSVRLRRIDLSIERFESIEQHKTFRLEFRLKNVGNATIKNVTLSIGLPPNVTAESPRKPPVHKTMEHPMGGVIDLGPDIGSLEMPELFGFNETTADFFVPGGRVATHTMHAANQGLLPDHSLEIVGLGFRSENYPDGSELILDYRVDADDMDPQTGKVSKRVPEGLEWLLQTPEIYGIPRGTTLEELKQMMQDSES